MDSLLEEHFLLDHGYFINQWILAFFAEEHRYIYEKYQKDYVLFVVVVKRIPIVKDYNVSDKGNGPSEKSRDTLHDYIVMEQFVKEKIIHVINVALSARCMMFRQKYNQYVGYI